jgi:hypothetical protein
LRFFSRVYQSFEFKWALLSRKSAFLNQHAPYRHAQREIDRKHRNRGSTGRSRPNKPRPRPPKMLLPNIPSRMKQRCELPRLRVQPRDVRTLELIASAAAESKVIERRFAAVLAGDHMIENMRQLDRSIGDAAILALMTSQPADLAIQ